MTFLQHSRKRRAFRRLVSLIPPNRVLRRIFRSTPQISIDGPSGSGSRDHLDASNILVRRVISCDKPPVTINILPDDVLLPIFDFVRVTYLGEDGKRLSWRWDRLVHVCQRWRSVVFASPNIFDLKIVCRPWTLKLADIWPPLPVIIRDTGHHSGQYRFAIVHPGRVCDINLLLITSWQLQQLSSAMQEPLPALIHLKLDLRGDSGPAPVLPDGFLGGSAPSLQFLELRSIPFPALPKLLLSATDLVRLTLSNIPHSGYLSPEVIVTGLAVLANLKSLTIIFESPLSRPDRERQVLPLPTRTILPALTRFEFKGVSEYLEDLVARIGAPLLDSIWVTLFHQLIFDIPQFAQFMRRTTWFQALNEAHVDFDNYGVQVGYLPPTQTLGTKSGLRISCRELDWQLSSAAQVFTSLFPSIYLVEHLYIYWRQYFPPQWQDKTENVQWLELFHSFAAVKNLYLSKVPAPHIVPALQELVGGRMTEVLPILQNIFLEELQPSGPIQEGIAKFVTARQLSDHPITVSHWERDSEPHWE